MTDVEILEEVEKVLAERGWTQGTEEDADGSVCLVGAIHVAMTGTAKPPTCGCEAIAGVYTVLGECAGLDFDTGAHDQHMTAWNDSPERTVDEVKAVISCAKEKLRVAAPA